jgi:hypothetical protein
MDDACTTQMIGGDALSSPVADWTASGAPQSCGSRTICTCAAIIALAILGLLRLIAQGSTLNVVYAEDGGVFLAGAMRHGLLASLATPYEGYLHTLPRVIASAITVAPLGTASVLMAFSASLVAGSLAVYVFVATRHWIPSRVVRGAVIVAMVLLPVAREEVVADLANLQWPLLFACFWALFSAGETRAVRRASGAVAVTAALSSPLALTLLPIAMWRLLFRRGHRVDRVCLAFVAAACLQAVVAVASMGDRGLRGHPVRDAGALVSSFGDHVVGGLVWWPPTPGGTLPPAVLGVAFLVLGSVCLIRRLRHGAKNAWLSALLAFYSVALFVVPAVLTGLPSRYAYVPGLMLLSAVAVAVPQRGVWIGVAVALVGLTWCASFPASQYRVSGPDWSTTITRAEQECTRGVTTASIPVGPYVWGRTPWRTVKVPCSSL